MKHAKTAHREAVIEQFLCPCGGRIKMVDVFKNGKLRHVARCVKCEREERKPSNFWA